MGLQRSWHRKPNLEQVEARELLSAITDILAAQSQPLHLASSGAILVNQAGVPPPIGPNDAAPTPRELARERFTAYFNGPFQVAPPRFVDQSEILLFRGLGGATQFRHGDFQMIINIPKDPTEPVVGAAYLQDRNINSSGVVGLDLTFNSFDSHGRPTQGTFTEDPNIYGGLFFVDTAAGTVTIKYSGNQATVRFNGLMYVSGITNPLRNMDLQAKGG